MRGGIFKNKIKLDPAIFRLQTAQNQPKSPFFGSFCLFDTLETNFLTRNNIIFSARYYSVKLKYKVVGMGYCQALVQVQAPFPKENQVE